MYYRLPFISHNTIRIALIGFMLLFSSVARAQAPFKNFENLFTLPQNYIVSYVKVPPVIDGDINDAVWQQAKWSNDFQDIEGDLKPKPAMQTNVKMLWGDSCLYIAAQIHDPHVWANVKHHDDIIFLDNDFEVFVNPNNTTHQYFEMEFNAINTLWDLFLNKPYRNGGNAMFGWNAEGLQSGVKIQGTLNNPADTDQGWTIEIAIPFKSINLGDRVQIPQEGTLWRINFSRVEWDTKVVDGKYVKLKDDKGRNLPEHNWIWSPQGVVDMHYPERWGYLQFSKENTANKIFVMPYAEQQKQYLWLVYYSQKQWFAAHHIYQKSLDGLGLADKVKVNDHNNSLQLEATNNQFMALIKDENDNITWTINQEGLVVQLKNQANE